MSKAIKKTDDSKIKTGPKEYKKPKPLEYFASIDIEYGGHNLDDPLQAIGVCHGSIHERTLDMFAFPVDRKDIKNMDDFWSKFLDILAVIEKHAVEHPSIFQDFIIYWRQFDDYKYALVCDNPGFDTAMLDYHNHKRQTDIKSNGKTAIKTGPYEYAPIRYRQKITSNDKREHYRMILNPVQLCYYHPRKTIIKKLAEKYAKHSHLPDEDAERNFLMQALIEYISNNPKVTDKELDLILSKSKRTLTREVQGHLFIKSGTSSQTSQTS